MRERSYQYYDKSAKKRTVSLTINSDLYEKAKAAGLNASQIAEEAIAMSYVTHAKAKLIEEIRKEGEAYDAFVAKYGSPAELARQHYAELEEKRRARQHEKIKKKNAV